MLQNKLSQNYLMHFVSSTWLLNTLLMIVELERMYLLFPIWFMKNYILKSVLWALINKKQPSALACVHLNLNLSMCQRPCDHNNALLIFYIVW